MERSASAFRIRVPAAKTGHFEKQKAIDERVAIKALLPPEQQRTPDPRRNRGKSNE